MRLDEWAARWNISTWALDDLRASILGSITSVCEDKSTVQSSESAVLSEIRLEATEKGGRLWRNNVGATYARDGSFLRYGLANESSAINRQVKSADLIGIRPIVIRPDMIGRTIGQFVSREVKAGGWTYRASEREQAQLKWAELILAFGGDACFTNGRGTL